MERTPEEGQCSPLVTLKVGACLVWEDDDDWGYNIDEDEKTNSDDDDESDADDGTRDRSEGHDFRTDDTEDVNDGVVFNEDESKQDVSLQMTDHDRETSVVEADATEISYFRILTIEKDLLEARCRFFRVALSSIWKEGQSNEIEMPEDEPLVVMDYLRYARKEKLPPRPLDLTDHEPYHNRLFRLYIFAEKYGDLRLCNTIMDEIIRMCDMGRMNGWWPYVGHPSWNNIVLAYRSTHESSKLRRIAINTYIIDEHILTPLLPGDLVDTPQEMLYDLCRHLCLTLVEERVDYGILPPAWGPRRANYHIHGSCGDRR